MAGYSPNDVAACLDPVVQDGEACVGNKVGEAHVCVFGDWVSRNLNRRLVSRRGDNKLIWGF